MAKKYYAPMWVFILCILSSMTIITITAIFYPSVKDFDKTTPTIIYIAGLIAGIGIPLTIMKTKTETVK